MNPNAARSTDWTPLVGEPIAITQDHPALLDDLARGEIPAVVFRQAYGVDECQRMIERLLERKLMHDAVARVPEEFAGQAIPEGYYRRADQLQDAQLARPTTTTGHRIDVGTSLGYRGADRASYFDHARATHQLFGELFRGLRSPVALLYDLLQRMAPDHQVITAVEPDGSQYGPAIFRIHYGNYSYPPHFDSVRLREARNDYAVYRYEHQFAGVLILQNAVAAEATAQCTVHRCPWTPALDGVLQSRRFHDYARRHAIASCRIELEPGDLYFFSTLNIHEVPGVAGELPRIVLAAFIGYSPMERQIMVWG